MKKRMALCIGLSLVLMITGCGRRSSTSAEQVHLKDYSGVPAYEQPMQEAGGDGTGAVIDPNADVQVDIWVDGTPSMSGFVAGDLASVYRKTLPRVEESAYNTWINADVAYYRFEVTLQTQDFEGIEGIEQYLDENQLTLEELTRSLYAFSPMEAGAKVRAYEQESFYGKTGYYENYSVGSGSVMEAVSRKVRSIAAVDWDSQALPPLRTALSMVDPDHLSVIVTDLYEEKGRVEQIGKLMTERFFENGKTVAVLGIQSEFAGLIYDIGESDMTIGYGLDENRRFTEYKQHPFYLLIIGDESQVNAFASVIKERLDAELSDSAMYACEVQMMKTGDWGETSNAADIENFMTDGVLIAQTQKDARQLESGQICDLRYTMARPVSTGRGQSAASSSNEETIYFEFTVPVRIDSDKDVDFSTFAYTGDVQVQRTVMQEVASGRRTGRDESTITAESAGLPITASVGSSKYAGDFETDEAAEMLVREVSAVRIGAVQRQGDELTCPVTFRVTMDAPQKIGIYRLLISAQVQCPAELFPTELEPWVEEWDISAADELTWMSDPSTFDGSKTLYLKRIMNQIVVSSNTLKTTGANALSPTHELVQFYVDLYVDEQGYFVDE